LTLCSYFSVINYIKLAKISSYSWGYYPAQANMICGHLIALTVHLLGIWPLDNLPAIYFTS